MKEDNIEFFDIVNENDEVIGKISENMQNTVKPSQLRFINIIITNDDEKIIGYGRIIGDGACFLYIQDVMVIPEYQAKKIGSMIIEKLKVKINEIKKEIPNIIVCLVATTGKEGFYEKLGFTKLDDTGLGTGMILK